MTDAALAQRRRNSREIARRKREATECSRGHEFTPENTYWRSDGRRQCVICKQDSSALAQLRRKLRLRHAA